MQLKPHCSPGVVVIKDSLRSKICCWVTVTGLTPRTSQDILGKWLVVSLWTEFSWLTPSYCPTCFTQANALSNCKDRGESLWKTCGPLGGEDHCEIKSDLCNLWMTASRRSFTRNRLQDILFVLGRGVLCWLRLIPWLFYMKSLKKSQHSSMISVCLTQKKAELYSTERV